MNSITSVLEGPVSGMTRIYALLLSITFLFEELPEGTAANDYVSGSFASLLIVPLVCVRNIKIFAVRPFELVFPSCISADTIRKCAAASGCSSGHSLSVVGYT